MTTQEKIYSLIQRIGPRISPEQSINEVFDSLQLVELLDAIEKEFSIRFPAAQMLFLERMNVEHISRAVDDLLVGERNKSPR